MLSARTATTSASQRGHAPNSWHPDAVEITEPVTLVSLHAVAHVTDNVAASHETEAGQLELRSTVISRADWGHDCRSTRISTLEQLYRTPNKLIVAAHKAESCCFRANHGTYTARRDSGQQAIYDARW